MIQQRIGAGSGGVVYRAFDHRLQRAVAVKIVDPALLGEASAWALAVSEARASGSLTHPNICAVFDVVEEDDWVCLAMELVEGRALYAAIPGHGLPAEATLLYGAQIASALAHAHDKGICHGDVTARNVILTLDGSVKVLDFGLARALGRNSSPAEPDEGVRRDLQQLGILLCQMATGVFPPQALDVLVGTAPPAAVLDSPPVAALPAGLRSVIARCLDINPAHRYQRAQQTAADLEDEFQQTRARAAAPATGRSRAMLAGGAVLLVAVAAFISLYVFNLPARGVLRHGNKSLQHATSQKDPALAAATVTLAGHAPKPARKVQKRPPATPPSTPQSATRTAASGKTRSAKPPPAPKHPAPSTVVAGLPGVKVWVNVRTRVYHCPGSRYYGKTLQGKYMTQAQARTAGYRPADGKSCQ